MSAFGAVLRYSFLLFVKVSASRMSVCFAEWTIFVKLEATIHENLFFVPYPSVSLTRRSITPTTILQAALAWAGMKGKGKEE